MRSTMFPSNLLALFFHVVCRLEVSRLTTKTTVCGRTNLLGSDGLGKRCEKYGCRGPRLLEIDVISGTFFHLCKVMCCCRGKRVVASVKREGKHGNNQRQICHPLDPLITLAVIDLLCLTLLQSEPATPTGFVDPQQWITRKFTRWSPVFGQ